VKIIHEFSTVFWHSEISLLLLANSVEYIDQRQAWASTNMTFFSKLAVIVVGGSGTTFKTWFLAPPQSTSRLVRPFAALIKI